MDTRQIDNFLTLYTCRNAHRAADLLFITQQGLSRSIQSLEKELQVTLFERSHAGMEPTAAADYLYGRFQALKTDLEDIHKGVQVVASGKVPLELPCSYGVLHTAYPFLLEFERLHPHIALKWEELTDREVERRVLEGRAAMGFAVRNPSASRLEFSPLFTRRKVLLVPSGDPLAAKAETGLDFADLKGRAIALEGPEFNANGYLIDACVREGFYPNVVAETSEITLCLRLAREGVALAVVPDFIAEMDQTHSLVPVLFSDPGFKWQAGLTWIQGSRPTGVMGELLEFLVANASRMQGA